MTALDRSVYPTIATWHVPRQLCEETARVLGGAAELGLEAGVLWLGDRCETSVVRALFVPEAELSGLRHGTWTLSADVYGIAARWAANRGVALLGLAHVHGRSVPKTLSSLDRVGGIRVPGLLSVVLGDGARDARPQSWGWYVFDRGDFRPLKPVELETRITLCEQANVEVAVRRGNAVLDYREGQFTWLATD